jgi:CheY-like chemotaxis protein
MPTSGPIIIVEDDRDDQEILKEVFHELKIPNVVRFFSSCKEALCYLLTTIERPFIIISDINLPAMNGLELKDKINQDQFLRRKNIPFLFLSTNSQTTTISTAYDLFAQGYFVKPGKIADLKEMVLKMIDYWKVAKRPAE